MFSILLEIMAFFVLKLLNIRSESLERRDDLFLGFFTD
jgi:hypothetical protein